MKRAFLCGLIALIGSVVALMSLSFPVEAIWHVKFDEDRLEQLVGRIAWCVAFVVFIVVWIRQANRKERQMVKAPPPVPTTKPENLEPIDYSSLAHLYDNPKPAGEKKPPA